MKKNNHMEKSVWLSWHLSRRSRSLSSKLGLPFIAKQLEGGLIRRHFISFIWTMYVITKKKPERVFIQYSFLLLFCIYLYKALFKSSLVIVCDCHTKALRRKAHWIINSIFERLKYAMFKKVNLFILATDGQLRDLSDDFSYFILPDPLPIIEPPHSLASDKEIIVFSCSFDFDEPISEIIEAAETLAENHLVFITGDYRKRQYSHKAFFVGFISDREYLDLIARSSCVVSLTNEDGCLQSAAYEALALGTPYVTTETQALKKYFGDNIHYCKNTSKSIVAAISTTLNDDFARRKVHFLKVVKEQEFNSLSSSLKIILDME